MVKIDVILKGLSNKEFDYFASLKIPKKNITDVTFLSTLLVQMLIIIKCKFQNFFTN